MSYQLGLRGVPKGAQAHQAGMVSQRASHFPFGECLTSCAGNPGDEGDAVASVPRTGRGRGQFQDWLQEPMSFFADRELRRVNAHRDAAGTGVDVVPGQRCLPPFVERPPCCEGQRVCRDGPSAQQVSADVQKLPSRCSK